MKPTAQMAYSKSVCHGQGEACGCWFGPNGSSNTCSRTQNTHFGNVEFTGNYKQFSPCGSIHGIWATFCILNPLSVFQFYFRSNIW